MTKHIQALGIGLCIVVAVCAGIMWVLHQTYPPKLETKLETIARDIERICAQEEYPLICYQREVPRLLDEGFSMEEAFSVVRTLSNDLNASNTQYFYCHVLAHEIAAKETAKDPEQWTHVIARCPAGLCENGCMHGAAQERFRRDALTDEELETQIPALKTICSSDRHGFTKMQTTACHHALGHLATYLTHGDIQKSLALCDRISPADDPLRLRVCYEGVFMQVYQPLEPEDVALVRDVAPKTPSALSAFCAPYEDAQLSACRTESWPLYDREYLRSPEGVTSFCAYNPGERWQERCYNDMFYIFARMNGLETEKVVTFCDTFQAPLKEKCFAYGAAASLESDYDLVGRSMAVCAEAQARGIGERCYTELLFYSGYNFHPYSPEFTSFCNAFPQEWKTRCLAGEGMDIKVWGKPLP